MRVVPRAALLVLTAVCLTAGPASARQEPPSQPVFRTGVDLVRIDATVRGPGDRPMTGLGPDDFEVEEDGVRQVISSVEFVRLDGRRRDGERESTVIRNAAHAEAEAAREDVRLFVVFLDDYHIDREPFITLTLRKHLEAFLDLLGPNDLVALMDPLTPLSALEFTRDRAALKAVIQRFEGRQGQAFPVRSAAEEAQLRRPDLRLVRAEVTYSALEAIATRLGGLREGRKSMLFVSQGPPSMDDMNRTPPLLQAVLQAAGRGSVMIHALDPRGLGSLNVGDANTLRVLAGETGGRAMVNVNDPRDLLAGAVEDQSAYYLIGYTPARTRGDGRFHRVSVKVRRPGARVVARRGYWAPDDAVTEAARAAAAERDADEGRGRVRAALTALSGGGDAAFALWLGTGAGPDGRTRLTIAWEPAPGGMRREDGARIARVTAEPLRADDGTTALAPPVEIPRTGAGAPSQAGSVDLPAGAVKLRLTAVDAAGATIDRFTQTVTLPAYGPDAAAMATPRFLRARTPAELRAIEADPQVAPAARRTFSRTDRVLVDLAWLGLARAPDTTVQAELLSRDGQRLAALDVRATGDSQARLTVPVGSLAPGTYLLRVSARAGDRACEQLAAFAVGF